MKWYQYGCIVLIFIVCLIVVIRFLQDNSNETNSQLIYHCQNQHKH